MRVSPLSHQLNYAWPHQILTPLYTFAMPFFANYQICYSWELFGRNFQILPLLCVFGREDEGVYIYIYIYSMGGLKNPWICIH